MPEEKSIRMSSTRKSYDVRHGRTQHDDSPYRRSVEAADYLRISLRALESFRSTGDGPEYRKHGGKVVYHVNDLDNWSNGRRYRSTSERGDK